MKNKKYIEELLEIALNDSEPDSTIIDDICDKLDEVSSSNEIAIEITSIIGIDATKCNNTCAVNKIIEYLEGRL